MAKKYNKQFLAQILVYLARGFNYHEIAKNYNCKPHVISSTVARGYKHSGTFNLLELFLWALQENLLKLEDI